MTRAYSIDAAADGYIRHRFVRAFGASYLVAIVFAVAAAIAVGLGMLVAEGRGHWAPLSLLVALVVCVFPLLLLVGLGGALIDTLHRRIVGGVLLVVSLYILVVAGGAALYALLQMLGVDFGPDATPSRDAPWLAALGGLGALIAYQMARQAWWQMTVSAEGFFAVRGWRPSQWRVLTTLRRHLGLPSFISHVARKRWGLSALYFGVAVLNLGLIMLLILPTTLGSLTEEDNWLAIGALLVTMTGLLAANLFGAGDVLARRAGAKATAMYQSVREWDTRAPVVFLRAFNQDDARLKATGGDPFARWPAGVGAARTLDEMLLEHASPYGPVIAIGDPRDPTPPLGAARVFVPERGNGWQDVVRGLVDASRCVVMCPNIGRGVQWELDLIANAAGRVRVIFLASPELSREDTFALFQRLVPDMPEIAADQRLIAAFLHEGQWRVATARAISLDSYVVGLNAALQTMFGLHGVKLEAPMRVRTIPSVIPAKAA